MPPEPTVVPPETAILPVSPLLANTLEEYLWAVGIFFGVIVISQLFKWLFLKRLKAIAKKTKGDLDDFLVEAISGINWWFFAAVGAYAGVHSLELPDIADTSVNYFFIIAVTIQTVKVLGEGITYALTKTATKEKNGKNTILHAFGRIINVLLWVFAGIFILSNFGVRVTSLIAGLVITTRAIALAVQPMLKDFIGAITIIGGGLFQNGDLIMFDGSQGTVESLGMRTTRLRTLQGEELIIPNSKLAEAKIQNFKNMQRRRVECTIGVKYTTPSEKLREIPAIIEGIIKGIEEAEFERCHFKEFGSPGLNIEIAYWVLSPGHRVYMDVRHRVNIAIKEEFEKKGIQFDRA
jgi:small-conductance mechanosensitive channel